MYSKEESKKLREEFWTSFGKQYPRKWMLYDTKMKEFQLKFTFTNKIAQVSLDVIDPDELIRNFYFEKITALKGILTSEYLPEAVFDHDYMLPEGKMVSRTYVEMENVSVHNKKDWPQVMDFLNRKMTMLEDFFVEYKDFLEE